MAKMKKAVWLDPNSVFASGPDSVGPAIDRLAKYGFDMVVPIVEGGDQAFYQSRIANVNANFSSWDPLEVLSAECRRAGLKLHPWLCVFVEGTNSALLKNRPELAAVDREGNKVGFACPARDEVQDYEFSLYEEVMDNYKIDGVHLDYIRYGNANTCCCRYCQDYCQEHFGADAGTLINPEGKNVTSVWQALKTSRENPAWIDFINWRVENVTKFVRRISKAAKARKTEVSAAVLPDYPYCIISCGQDWPIWAKEGLVDFLFPMNYINHPKVMMDITRNHLAAVGGACPVWEGLGKYSSRSVLTTGMLEEQVRTLKDNGVDGLVIFSYSAMEDADFAAIEKY